MSLLGTLLRCVGEAVVLKGPKALASLVPFGEVSYEIAEEAFRRIRAALRERNEQAALAAAAAASPEEAKREAQAAARQVASEQNLSPQTEADLVRYLSLVPCSVRQTLKRPADPTGKTVPASFALKDAEQLVALLPSRLPSFQPGDRPAGVGNWELVELLGAGGFGEVWLARNPDLHGLKAALKFCLDPQAAASLRNEAALLDRVMSQGRHPGIVALRQAYLTSSPLCLEYEYVNGGDLASLVAEWQRGGKIPVRQVCALIQRLAEVVGHAHRLNPPIVHRDLKPANVLVERADGKIQLRVTDFGIGGIVAAQALKQTRQTTSRQESLATSLRGAHTPLYASPQQMRGDSPSPRDDVHALGVVWYQMLTGDLTSGVPADWTHVLEELGLEQGLISLLGSCVSSKPERRPADAADLANHLQTLLEQPRSALPVAAAEEEVPLAQLLPPVEPPAPRPAPRQAARTVPRPRSQLTRRGEPEAKDSSAWVIFGVLGAVGLLLVVGGAVAIWSFVAWSRPVPMVPRNQNQVAWNDGRPDGVQPPPLQFPMPPDQKETPPAPPQNVTLIGGKYEGDVPFAPEARNKNWMEAAFRFQASAGKVYRAQVKGNPSVGLRVVGPGGKVGDWTPWSRKQKSDVAFEVTQTGTYVVTVSLSASAGDKGPCRLALSEVDGTDPLPDELQLTPDAATLPKLEERQKLNVYDKRFTSSAFSPDGKSFLTCHTDHTLGYWADAHEGSKGAFQLPNKELLFGLGIDGKGRIYAQRASFPDHYHAGAKRPVGDLSVWSPPSPPSKTVSMPSVEKVVKVGGLVTRMVPSPDGAYLYFLDTHNGKLCRIDAEKVAIDAQLDVGPGVPSFCLTPDGKRLYCCSEGGMLQVIDPDLKLKAKVRLDAANVRDVAATDSGLVILAQRGGSHRFDASNASLIDLSRGLPEQAKASRLPVTRTCEFVRLIPGRDVLIFSGDRTLVVCGLPRRPGIDRATATEAYRWDYNTQGQFVISPDGRTLLLDTGTILSISR